MVRSATILLLVAAVTPACAVPSSSPASPSSTADSSTHYQAEVAFCVEETNRYRASVGLPAVTRSATLETYAIEAARADARARTPHHHARTTNHGNGTARAENEILWWPLSTYKSVRNVIAGGLEDMWKQGADGAHYRNLVGPYTEVGCGIFVQGDEVTVVQAFR